ncbi:hypothetical protein BJV74DRAFT_854789 [Russula compacta]|nr:hypothetical protein BJV74DRAFT_854789 [Russula compacta]
MLSSMMTSAPVAMASFASSLMPLTTSKRSKKQTDANLSHRQACHTSEGRRCLACTRDDAVEVLDTRTPPRHTR